MDIQIPENINKVLSTLTEAGYEAFVVGGCVRDAIMGRTANDWDVTTSARPDAIKACFRGIPTIDTGIKHGTVTVLMDGEPVEVTTYRIDGEYLDGRHPETVEFTENLEEDLARRDFTMNAMAYCPGLGIFDPFGGQGDIKASRIRSVGEPRRRFEEDALRIMRGVRFASVLGFEIEEGTLNAMKTCAGLMKKVSAERINVELSKMILGKNVDNVLQECEEIIKAVVPEFTAIKVGHLPENLVSRLAELFPENIKPVLRRLKYDNNTIRQASLINDLKRQYLHPPTEKVEILRILKDFGEEVTRLYYDAHTMLGALAKAMEGGACWRCADLKVSGGDVIAAGIGAGPAVGQVLDELLHLVIEGELENDREQLLAAIKFRKERELL